MPPDPAPSVLRPSDRLIGWLAVLVGATAAFGIQVVSPVGVPLYDGVVVQEPYRFLHPTGDQPGSPTSFASSVEAVAGGDSPQVIAPTTESPPQAQLVALPGAFTLPPGVTRLSVSVAAVEPPAVAPDGQIAGNVYRFSVAVETGTPLAIKPCEGCISLVMRAPEDLAGEARLQRYANGAWTNVETVHAGTVGMYSTNPTALGDYAIVTGSDGGPSGGPGGGPSPGPSGAGEPGSGLALESYIVAGGAAVILALLFVAALLLRRRPAPIPQPSRTRPVPSKRKRTPKPPPRSPDP